MLQTRSQKFASSIHAKVSELATPAEVSAGQKQKSRAKKYGAMAHKLPVLIRTAGLAQALAFVEASGEKMHQKLLQDLSEIVTPGRNLSEICRSTETSLQEYMRLTRAALEALLWFKRFAQSVLDVKSGADE